VTAAFTLPVDSHASHLIAPVTTLFADAATAGAATQRPKTAVAAKPERNLRRRIIIE
jgi:hypothetical protein